MERHLNAAVLGSNATSSAHARALLGLGVELAYVFGGSPEQSAKLAEVYPHTEGPAAFETIVESDVDVVHVFALPSDWQLEIVEPLLAAGKHVVLDNPVGLSTEQARAVVELGQRGGRLVVPTFALRYHEGIAVAARRVRGDAPAVHTITGLQLQASAPRLHAGPAGLPSGAEQLARQLAAHWFDAVGYVFDSPITAVSAMVAEGDAALLVQFRLASGAVGHLSASRAAAGHSDLLRIDAFGAEQSIGIEVSGSSGLRVGSAYGLQEDAEGAAVSDASLAVPGAAGDPLRRLLADVYGAVRGDVSTALPQAGDIRRSAAISDAVLASISSGAWASVDN